MRLFTEIPKVKLINGDCLIEMDKLEKVDHVLTSPPYNRKRNDKYRDYDDNISDWYGFNVKAIDKLLKLTKGYIFYNLQSNYYNRKDVYKLIGNYSEDIVEIIVWEKSNPLPAAGKAITNAVEYFLVLGDESLKSNSTYVKNIITTSVNSKMPKEHKAVMNQNVADFFITNFTKKGDTILDCFMGTGTTGVSCMKYNRNFIGIELKEAYYKMSVNKISKGGG